MAKQYPTHGQWAAEQHAAPFSEVFADMKDRLVYLTADATTELTELLPDHAYIIGGIVDRNRYKNLCLDRAKELGIKSARLPIGDHLKLAGSKVFALLLPVFLLDACSRNPVLCVPAQNRHANVLCKRVTRACLF